MPPTFMIKNVDSRVFEDYDLGFIIGLIYGSITTCLFLILTNSMRSY